MPEEEGEGVGSEIGTVGVGVSAPGMSGMLETPGSPGVLEASEILTGGTLAPVLAADGTPTPGGVIEGMPIEGS